MHSLLVPMSYVDMMTMFSKDVNAVISSSQSIAFIMRMCLFLWSSNGHFNYINIHSGLSLNLSMGKICALHTPILVSLHFTIKFVPLSDSMQTFAPGYIPRVSSLCLKSKSLKSRLISMTNVFPVKFICFSLDHILCTSGL